jgi:hypothetical protein
MTPDQFMVKYVNRDKPVILTGIGDDWGSAEWGSKARFIEMMGTTKVKTGPPQDLTLW